MHLVEGSSTELPLSSTSTHQSTVTPLPTQQPHPQLHPHIQHLPHIYSLSSKTIRTLQIFYSLKFMLNIPSKICNFQPSSNFKYANNSFNTLLKSYVIYPFFNIFQKNYDNGPSFFLIYPDVQQPPKCLTSTLNNDGRSTPHLLSPISSPHSIYSPHCIESMPPDPTLSKPTLTTCNPSAQQSITQVNKPTFNTNLPFKYAPFVILVTNICSTNLLNKQSN